MLQSYGRGASKLSDDSEFAEQPVLGLADVDRVLSALRRQWHMIVRGWLVAVLLGGIYAFGTPHSYTASMEILAATDDHPLSLSIDAQSRTATDVSVSFVDTQVEVLRSEHIAIEVIKRLHLDTDEEFLAGPGGILPWLRSNFSALVKLVASSEIKGGNPQDERRWRTAALLRENLEIDRVGHTSVVQLGFTWTDPGRAVLLANTFGSVYLDDQVNARHDAAHRASVWLAGEMAAIKQKAALADLEVQKSRTLLNMEVTASPGGTSRADGKLEAMRNQEREADTYKSLYQLFLQRHQEMSQQQSAPISETRVVSDARMPERPRGPKRGLILLLASAFGCVMGAAFGGLLELRERTFRTSAQLEKETPLECLGMLPLIAPRQASGTSVDRYILDYPRSNFAENLRRIKLSVDTALPNDGARVIAIVSAVHGEGRTTVARNLGHLLARPGARTALIEADIKERGTIDVRSAAAHAGVTARDSGLDIVSLDLANAATSLSDLLSSPAFLAKLTTMQEHYQYILLDLPPLGPVVGVQMLAPHIGGFLLVIEWGKTQIDSVHASLNSDPCTCKKLLGAIFNKVDMARLKLYFEHGSKDPAYEDDVNYHRAEA